MFFGPKLKIRNPQRVPVFEAGSFTQRVWPECQGLFREYRLHVMRGGGTETTS